jgi:hypothetical protein
LQKNADSGRKPFFPAERATDSIFACRNRGEGEKRLTSCERFSRIDPAKMKGVGQ